MRGFSVAPLALMAVTAVSASAAEVRLETVGLKAWVPDGWSQEADEAVVVVEEPSGAAVAVFGVVPAGTPEDDAAALEQFVADVMDEAEVVDELGPVSQHGIEGRVMTGAGVIADEGEEPIAFIWIAGTFSRQGQTLMVLATTEADAEAHLPVLGQIVDSIQPIAAAAPAAATPVPPATPPGEAGPRFELSIAAPSNADYQRFEQLLRESRRLDVVVGELNENLVLNTPVAIRVAEGDGPVFDPDTNEIVMNYEFMADTDRMFREGGLAESDEDVQVALLDVLEWVLYHEVGHALIAQYEIPIVGREEDAVDSLAAVVTLEFVDNGADIASSAAGLWLASADSRELEDNDFWDVHSLDLQRFTAIICWMVGSNPEGEQELATEFEFDDERTMSCVGDYQQKVASWMTLLEPHLRPE